MRKRLRSTFYFLGNHNFLMHLLERNSRFSRFPCSKSGFCEGSDARFYYFKSSENHFPPQYVGVRCTKNTDLSTLKASENSGLFCSAEGLAGGGLIFLSSYFFSTKMRKWIYKEYVDWISKFHRVFSLEINKKINPVGAKIGVRSGGGSAIFFPFEVYASNRTHWEKLLSTVIVFILQTG